MKEKEVNLKLSDLNISKYNTKIIKVGLKGINNNKNRNIQEGFYRLINHLCLYFYQNLSLKSDDDKEDLKKIIINRKNKGLNDVKNYCLNWVNELREQYSDLYKGCGIENKEDI